MRATRPCCDATAARASSRCPAHVIAGRVDVGLVRTCLCVGVRSIPLRTALSRVRSVSPRASAIRAAEDTTVDVAEIPEVVHGVTIRRNRPGVAKSSPRLWITSLTMPRFRHPVPRRNLRDRVNVSRSVGIRQGQRDLGGRDFGELWLRVGSGHVTSARSSTGDPSTTSLISVPREPFATVDQQIHILPGALYLVLRVSSAIQLGETRRRCRRQPPDLVARRRVGSSVSAQTIRSYVRADRGLAGADALDEQEGEPAGQGDRAVRPRAAAAGGR